MMKRYFTNLAIVGALCALYYYAGKLGFSLAVVYPHAAAVWPPTGIALAAVLLFGYRVWPGILLGAFLVNVTTAGSIATSLGIATGNTLGALLGALLARRCAKGSGAFDRANDVVKFVFFAGMTSTMISATLGVTSLCLGGFADWDNYAAIWTTWWLGDLTSDLVVAPLLLVWGAKPVPRGRSRSMFDAVSLLLLVFFFGQIVFGDRIFSDIKYYPRSFLWILPLVLSALRFGQHGAVTASAAMSATAIWGTLHGFGPFAVENPRDSLLLLQVFMATIAVIILLLAAVLSERTRAEETLRQSEERFRAMIENIKGRAIFMLDPEGRVLTWNNGAERIWGYQSEDIIGKRYSCLLPIKDQGGGKPEQLLEAALAEGQCEKEGWHWRKGGPKFWAEVVITPVRDGDEKLIGFSTVTRDLTLRRLMEENLKHVKEEAEAANEAKSAFLANISHEIRTPMTGIIGMAGLLSETELSPEQSEYCEIIRRSSDSLLTVINEVLDFSKIESGKLDLEMIDFDLRSSVEDVINLFAKQAQDKGIDLISFIHYDVPMVLQGDPGRLRQVLSNLVSNALKYTEEGEVVVRVTVLKENATHATLRFSVTDTGIGIAAEKLGTLFHSFTQVDASITRKYGGTGLGLAICKKLVDLMGGGIGVYSDEKKGSSFWLTLQFLKQHAGDRQSLTSRRSLLGARSLIVEGNATLRAVLEHYLTSLGIENQIAEDGQTALKRLRTAANKGEPYDVAILDSRLPGIDGLELARTIRQEPGIGSPKLLLLTSVGQRGDGKLAQEMGVDACLTKPVGFSCLSECLAVLMGEAPKDDDSVSLVTGHALAKRKHRRRLRLLVADDNHINQKVVVSLLKQMGHRADVVGNGKEALEAFKLVPYDIILMDVQMPDMDGFEASRQIRAVEEKKGYHTPIIAITAHARKEDREKCLAAGIDDYVSKPINPEDLKASIARRIAAVETMPSTDPAPASPARADVLNVSEALTLVDGNRELLCEVARMFLNQYPKFLEQTHQALSRADCESLSIAAHTMAASVGQLAGQRAFAAAKKLEQVSTEGDFSEVPEVLAELEKELQLLKSAVSDPAYFTL